MENKNIQTIDDIVDFMLKRASCVSRKQLILAKAHIGDYKTYEKSKKSCGVRKISAPHKKLKILQRGLLDNFFDRIRKRGFFYKSKHNKLPTSHLVAYQKVLSHRISKNLHGSLKEKSVRTASLEHVYKDHLFATHFDLKDAYPSVNVIHLAIVLHTIITDEVLSYYLPFKQRRTDQKMIANINSFFDRNKKLYCEEMSKMMSDMGLEDATFRTVEIMYNNVFTKLQMRHIYPPLDKSSNKNPDWYSNEKRRTSLINRYPKYPLFPSNSFHEFREIIRNVVDSDVEFASSRIPEIITEFTGQLIEICTHEKVLPQGAPSSGFLLALVISEFKIIDKIRKALDPDEEATISVYVDDILIMSNKKPTEQWKARIVKAIESAKVFKVNIDKTYSFDLRNQAMPFLGGKIARVPKLTYENVIEKNTEGEETSRNIIRVEQKNEKTGEIKTKLAFTLSVKKQKQYRAFLYRICTKKYTEKELNLARGYYGHIISVYGNIGGVPSSLHKVVCMYKEKFPTYIIYDPEDWMDRQNEFRFKAHYKKNFRTRYE